MLNDESSLMNKTPPLFPILFVNDELSISKGVLIVHIAAQFSSALLSLKVLSVMLSED